MALEFKIESHGDAFVKVSLEGSLDTASSPQLETALGEVLSSTTSTLVFDMAKLAFLTSAGIRVLSLARKSLASRNGTVAMVNMQPQIVKVFEIVRALPGFSVFSSTDELDSYLLRMQVKARG